MKPTSPNWILAIRFSPAVWIHTYAYSVTKICLVGWGKGMKGVLMSLPFPSIFLKYLMNIWLFICTFCVLHRTYKETEQGLQDSADDVHEERVVFCWRTAEVRGKRFLCVRTVLVGVRENLPDRYGSLPPERNLSVRLLCKNYSNNDNTVFFCTENWRLFATTYFRDELLINGMIRGSSSCDFNSVSKCWH